MAATATASPGPRYAPDDPSLPKPWRGLVDGKTGYLYFWNPETNVTQYERPVSSSHGSLSSNSPRPSSGYISSSVQVHQSPSHGQRRNVAYKNDDDDRYSRGSSGERSQQCGRGGNSANEVVAAASIGGRGHAESGAGLSAEGYRHRHEISVTGGSVPSPFSTFEATGFPSEILKEVALAGFSAPTPIQAQSWPIALQGRDIVAIAKTGSGKTLGYLIPGFVHLKRSRNNAQMGPTVLVLSPTRELATQIQDEAVKFGKSSRIQCTCLYGGAPKGPQLRELDRGADIVVATPGRLNDILEARRVSLHQVSYLVLDEADRMLDMGFEPQIRKIVNEVPTRRQTLMFTATWPKEVRKIAADFMSNPVQVNIGNADELVANKSITQYVEVLSPMEKQRRLEQILRSQEQGSKIIIFCATKKMCDLLARNLARQFGAVAIHGDKSQGERDHVLNQFRTGRSPVLVATDVAARGLDIKDIRVVINFDFPTGVEDYVHRIGRTGRAGATGVSYTFFSDQDSKYASDLIKILEGANQRVPQEVRDMALRGVGMNKFRRWSSGPGGCDGGRGGRSDSGYGGRGRDRYDRGYNDSYDADARGKYGGYQSKNGRNEDWGRGRSHSRSPSPKPRMGWSGTQARDSSQGWKRGRSRSRSHSPERFDRGPPVRSFHQLMMERSRTSSPKNKQTSPASNYNDGRSEWRKPIAYGHDSEGRAGSTRSYPEDEEEEGVIHPEE